MIEPDRMSHLHEQTPNPYDPDRPFLVTGDRRWSYGELVSLSTVWERRIQSLTNLRPDGIRSGKTRRPETFLLLRSRNPEALILHTVCAWIARVPVLPIDPDLPVSELESLSTTLPWVGALVDEPDEALSNGFIHENPVFGRIREILTWSNEGDNVVALPDSNELRNDPDAWWGALLTSGSSGSPKAVPHRRRSWIHATDSAQSRTPMRPGEAWLLPLPIHHAGGMNVILRALLTGSAVRLAHPADPSRLAEILRTHPEIRAASMVPTQLGRLLDKRPLSIPTPFHGILVGGGPIRESLLRRAAEAGLSVIASYGMTETVGQIASRSHSASGSSTPEMMNSRTKTDSRSKSHEDVRILPDAGPRPSASGALQVHTPHNVRILDELGTPRTETGEGALQIRGPQLFEGYLNGPTLLRDRFDPDGWFHTGDWARLHPGEHPGDPLLEILSRRTDLILSGGENVIPARVEAVLESLPEIREAMVVGIEDAEWGERVIALVIPGPTEMKETSENRSDQIHLPGSPAEEALLDSIQHQISGRLAPAERPKEFLIVDRLPTLGPGKRDRREAKKLARRLLEGQSG